MITILVAFGTAFLIALFGIPSIITVAKLKGLYDKPTGRKQHAPRIPRIGGIAIYAGFILAVNFYVGEQWLPRFRFMEASLFMLFFAGLKDDIVILSPWNKLGIQILAAGLVCIGQQIHFEHAYGLFGWQEIPAIISIPCSMMAIIFITNAFNLIDGVDGLAGGIGLITSLAFAVWFYIIGDIGFSIMGFALAGTLLAFLFFNSAPAKIFMGDGGSLTIGFIISVFFVHTIQGSYSSTAFVRNENLPVLAIAFCMVPIYDTLRVIILRLYRRKSLFEGDRLHIHHALLKTGMTTRAVSFSLYAVSLLFVLSAFALKSYDFSLYALVVVTLSVVLGQLPFYLYRHLLADLEAEGTLHELIQSSEKGKDAEIQA